MSMGDWKKLLDQIDLGRISTLAKKVNLPKLIGIFSQLEPADLAHLASLVRAKHRKTPLPVADGDFYDIGAHLTDEERAIRARVREFMQAEVEPIANDCWLRGEFPLQIIPKLAALDLAGMTFTSDGFPARRNVLEGVIAQEIARVDVSISTFFGVQSGLAMGSIYLCGSDEQRAEYLPKMRRFELLGAFGLTEPDVGSGAAGGLHDDLSPRRRPLDHRWSKEVDRQRDVRRFHDHLGARRERRSGQRLHRRPHAVTASSPRRSATRWRCVRCRTPRSR